jgi:hypothetical protein
MPPTESDPATLRSYVTKVQRFARHAIISMAWVRRDMIAIDVRLSLPPERRRSNRIHGCTRLYQYTLKNYRSTSSLLGMTL